MSCFTFSPYRALNQQTDAEKGADLGDGHDIVRVHAQSSTDASDLDKSSGTLFSIYSDIVSEEDKLMVERWQKDADGILIFTGLFSAAVAAFLTISFQDLRPDPQETSAFYLKNIYQVLTESNIPNLPTPSIVAQPPAFSVSTYTIAVNLIWILSLGISLTCAVMATMLQQWARQYHKLSQMPQHDPKTKARIHALYSRSTDKMFIQCLGFALPLYLHLSVLLFFIGLFLFLRDFDDSILHAAIGFFGFCMAIYGFFTVLPLFLHDSLLFTPFSTIFVSLSAFLGCIATTMSGHRFNARIFNLFDSLFKFVERTTSDLTSRHELSKSELDIRILEKTLVSLGKDGAVEKFFEAIPDFFPSDARENRPITGPLANKFEDVMRGFLDRTFTGTTITEEDKNTRLLVCLEASHAAPALGPKKSWVLSEILKGKWPERLQSVEMGHSLRSWSNGRNDRNDPSPQYVRCIISRIIENAKKHDDRWSALVVDELGISEDVLRDYLARDDNILLANFNNIARQILRSYPPCLSWKVSSLLSKCDISRALPRLRHDFCNLRDEIAQEAQKCEGSILDSIYQDIRNIYITSDEEPVPSPTAFTASVADRLTILDQPSSYPSYSITGHRSHQMHNDYDDPADVVSPRLTTNSGTQAVPPRGEVSVGRTHPLITPAPRATQSPTHEPSSGAVPDAAECAPPTRIASSSLPALLASQPSPTLPPDVTAVGARPGSIDPSAISSAANRRSHSTSGGGGLGVSTSQQNDDVNSVMPPSSINGTLPRSDHHQALGYLSPSMMASRPRPYNPQDPDPLSLAGDPH